jgi:hypothetical protein
MAPAPVIDDDGTAVVGFDGGGETAMSRHVFERRAA